MGCTIEDLSMSTICGDPVFCALTSIGLSPYCCVRTPLLESVHSLWVFNTWRKKWKLWILFVKGRNNVSAGRSYSNIFNTIVIWHFQLMYIPSLNLAAAWVQSSCQTSSPGTSTLTLDFPLLISTISKWVQYIFYAKLILTLDLLPLIFTISKWLGTIIRNGYKCNIDIDIGFSASDFHHFKVSTIDWHWIFRFWFPPY